MSLQRSCGLIIITVLIAIAGGCKKDKDEPLPAPPENSGGGSTATLGTMNATIINNTYSSNNATARFRSNGQLTIKATDGDEKTFFLVINNFSGTVTYTMGVGSQNLAAYQYNLGDQNFDFSTANNGTGALTITEYNESEQLISGNFSFTAGQSGSPENIIEITGGEFNDVPIQSIQMPAPGEAVFYYNDQLHEADSVEATLLPPYTVEVKLFHELFGGWFATYRRFLLYPDYSQNAQGYYAPSANYFQTSGNFHTEFDSESNVVSQTMALEYHISGIYDLEYAVNELPLSMPYQPESGTVLLVDSDQEATIYTEAFLSPDENGHYELTATNNIGGTLTITNISENPLSGVIGNHGAIISINAVSIYGECFWQESELGNGFHSIEFSILSPSGIPFVNRRVVGKDIQIVE